MSTQTGYGWIYYGHHGFHYWVNGGTLCERYGFHSRPEFEKLPENHNGKCGVCVRRKRDGHGK